MFSAHKVVCAQGFVWNDMRLTNVSSVWDMRSDKSVGCVANVSQINAFKHFAILIHIDLILTVAVNSISIHVCLTEITLLHCVFSFQLSDVRNKFLQNLTFATHMSMSQHSWCDGLTNAGQTSATCCTHRHVVWTRLQWQGRIKLAQDVLQHQNVATVRSMKDLEGSDVNPGQQIGILPGR